MAQGNEDSPVTDMEDPRYVKALSHPLRVRILSMLEEGNASPVQLAEHLEATLGTVAYHVRTLERLGLITMVATHQRRGATEHVYAAREHPRFSDRAWARTHPMAKHVMVASALSEAGEFATQSAAAGGFDRADAQLSRRTLTLDEEGFGELAGAAEQWLGEVARIEAAAERRLARQADGAIDAGVITMVFEAQPFTGATHDGSADAGNPRRRGRRATR